MKWLSKNQLIKKLVASKAYQSFKRAFQRIRLKRGQVDLWTVLRVYVRNIERHDVFELANGVAFSFTLSVFPLIIFLFTLIPFLNAFLPGMEVDVPDFFEETLPDYAFEAIYPTVEDLLNNRRGGLLSLGFILAFYFSSNAVSSLMRAFNRIYRTKEARSFFRMRAVATVLTLMLGGVFFVATILIVLGQVVLRYLDEWGITSDSINLGLLIFLRFVAVLVVFQIAISFIYRYGPSMRKRFKFFSWGSILASLASIATSFGFAFYVANFGTYNRIYGSIGTLIAIMVWFYLLSNILLLGFELNASIERAARQQQDGSPPIKRHRKGKGQKGP